MDELLGRRAPYAAEAEQAILGAMLFEPKCISDVVTHVHGSDFYLDVNRDIFDTINAMFAAGMQVDPITVLEEMENRHCLKPNSRQYLADLMDATPTATNVLKYCQIVQDRALLRALGDSAAQITEQVYQQGNRASQVLELAEKKIYALRRQSTVGGLVPMTQVLEDTIGYITKAAEGGSKLPGIATGLTDIDECLQGLGAGHFVLIASRPGMGKTSIALNIAVNAARTSHKAVAIFSLEMTRQELVMRMLASESHIDLSQLNLGRLNPDEWSRLMEAAGVLSGLDILLDDNPTMTVAEMAAQCRRLDNLGLVVVDYLQLMQSSGSGMTWANESRTQAVGDISRMMKVSAKELGVPLVCMSQLSRVNETAANKRPTLAALRESGSIEQDADAVIGLYREGYYNQECEDPNLAEAIILKNRHGRTGTIYLRWLPEYTAYVNDESRHGDEY